MSALDIIELPGHPGKYGRRVLVEAWVTAGSPPVNSAGRLYDEQKAAWDAYQNGTGSPADNPDDESQRLAHVRFAALDIDSTPDRIRRLSDAGLYRPYSYEPWHWELPNVRQYALVRSIPTITLKSKEDEDMPDSMFAVVDGVPSWCWINWSNGKVFAVHTQKEADWIGSYMGSVKFNFSGDSDGGGDKYKNKLALVKLLNP